VQHHRFTKKGERLAGKANGTVAGRDDSDDLHDVGIKNILTVALRQRQVSALAASVGIAALVLGSELILFW
jgi:hypothetical protein